jgi:hypothetical protein
MPTTSFALASISDREMPTNTPAAGSLKITKPSYEDDALT